MVAEAHQPHEIGGIPIRIFPHPYRAFWGDELLGHGFDIVGKDIKGGLGKLCVDHRESSTVVIQADHSHFSPESGIGDEVAAAKMNRNREARAKAFGQGEDFRMGRITEAEMQPKQLGNAKKVFFGLEHPLEVGAIGLRQNLRIEFVPLPLPPICLVGMTVGVTVEI